MTLTDFLITITVVQTAIIAFLVALIFFKFKKSINQPATDKIDNVLSKKLASLDTKVSLISNEFSQAIKENTENITKLSSTVNTTSASTAAALATANSSLSSLSTSSSAFLNPAMTSGLFERNTENNFIKPQFLEIDDDNPDVETTDAVYNDKIKIDPKIVRNFNALSQNSIEEANPFSFISVQNSESRGFSPSPLNLGSRIRLRGHLDQSVLKDWSSSQEEKQKRYNQSVNKETEEKEKENEESANLAFATSERSKEFQPSSSNFLEEHETINDISANPESNPKNNKENPDSNSSNQKLENNERNSNPEIDKLDIEILSALKRLGGMDETSAKEHKIVSTSVSTDDDNKENNKK